MRYVGNSLLCLMILVSCQKKDRYPDVQIVGHGGSGLHTSTAPYHDNTLESVQYALEISGIVGVEIDVQISADGTAWLFHDDELSGETNGDGCINSKTDTYLSTLHYKSFNQEQLCRLEQILFVDSTKSIFLDLREINTCSLNELKFEAIQLALQHGLVGFKSNQINIITNRGEWVNGFQQLGWKVYLNSYDVHSYMSNSYWLSTTGICVRNKDISADQVSELNNLSKKVIIFDVRSPKGIRSALKKEPSLLLTDDLKATLIEKYR